MPSIDLPIELWLEILSYLPRTALRGLIGVNRALFELAMDVIYEECRLICHDETTSKLLTQHPDIAKRVRHLYIRPDFLPRDEVDQKESFCSKLGRKLLDLKSIIISKDSRDEACQIFRSWGEATNRFSNLRELTIVLHDNVATPSFLAFLSALWNSGSMGPNLKRLSLNITPAKLTPLLKTITNHPSAFPGFEELVLDISSSRQRDHAAEAEDWLLATKGFRSFLASHCSILTSLSISSAVNEHLGQLFDGLPLLPNLKELQFLALLNPRTFSKRESFTKFIAIHSSTLENFVIKCRPRTTSIGHSSGNPYALWLTEDPAGLESICSFSQLVLPKIHTLTIGLENIAPYSTRFLAPWDRYDASLLPRLSSVTPNLTKLFLTETSIKLAQLVQILNSLALYDGESVLEELSYVCDSICPVTFDILSTKLLRLKSLTITYFTTSGDTDCWNSRLDFCARMETREYPTWPVRYLRLLRASGCGEGHPCEGDMKIVASCISPGVIMNSTWECTCAVNS